MSEPNDPMRLADAAPVSELGRLMTSATRDLPSDQELAQLAEHLGAVLGPVHGMPAAPGYSIVAKLGAATGIAALIVAGVLASRRHPAPATPLPASPPMAAVTAKPAPDSALTPAPAPTPALPVASAALSSAVRSSSPPSRRPGADSVKSGALGAALPSESALLEQARRVLASDPAAALSLTNQDPALFPHGVLVQEREVIAIEALRRLNRTADADRRAAAFSKAYPGSAHNRVVEDASGK